MKKMYFTSLTVALCFIVAGLSLAQDMYQDIALYKACKYCGMNRGMYDFSRMLIDYADGSSAAFCSLHCASVDLANSIDKSPKSIQVGDFKGKQLIDAETAFWVLGGGKPGVMSKRGKWAFFIKEDAENFVQINKGKIASFEEAVKMAYEDMYDDTKAIRERRQLKRIKTMEHNTGVSHGH